MTPRQIPIDDGSYNWRVAAVDGRGGSTTEERHRPPAQGAGSDSDQVRLVQCVHDLHPVTGAAAAGIGALRLRGELPPVQHSEPWSLSGRVSPTRRCRMRFTISDAKAPAPPMHAATTPMTAVVPQATRHPICLAGSVIRRRPSSDENVKEVGCSCPPPNVGPNERDMIRPDVRRHVTPSRGSGPFALDPHVTVVIMSVTFSVRECSTTLTR